MPNLTQTPLQVKAVAGVATCHNGGGIVESEALTTAAGAVYTLTIGCNQVNPPQTPCVVLASVCNGTNTQGDIDIQNVTPGAGSIVVKAINRHASQALNGTLKISFVVFW